MDGTRERSLSIKDQHGLSLIEILIAVTIMSIISVTIMGYFVTAMDRSADENRRIIAANLARLKTGELREMGKKSDFPASVAAGQSNYQSLLDELTAVSERIYSEAAPFPGPHGTLLDPTEVINGTVYSYKAVLDKVYRPGTDASIANYLLRLRVTVYWQEGAATLTSTNSTTIESYLVKPRSG